MFRSLDIATVPKFGVNVSDFFNPKFNNNILCPFRFSF